jgi:CheY-like chemotaxis protein
MMGGSIDVSSRPGAGTTFTVRLPATVGAIPAAAPVAEAPEGEAPTVLVIDDDPAARDLVTRLLARAGFRVITAPDGATGLARARAERPAVITLDVVMPAMDGWEVLTALKSDPAVRDIPVVMLSILDEQQLGFALGAADFLTKPVDRTRLLDSVRAHAGSSEALVSELRQLAAAQRTGATA